jgi:hypothetical protein
MTGHEMGKQKSKLVPKLGLLYKFYLKIFFGANFTSTFGTGHEMGNKHPNWCPNLIYFYKKHLFEKP